MLNKLKTKNIAYISLILMSFIYSLNYLVSKVILNSEHNITGEDYAFIRVGFAAFFFIILNELLKKEKTNWKKYKFWDFPKLILCGFLMAYLSQVLFFEGLKTTTAINGSLMRMSTPISIFMIALIFGQEKFNLKKFKGVGLAGIGAVILILTSGNVKSEPIDSKIALMISQASSANGDLLILLSAIAFGIYTVLSRHLIDTRNFSSISTLKWSFLFGLMIMLSLRYFSNRPLVPEISFLTFHFTDWLAISFMLIIATCLSYFLNIFALETLDASTVGIFSYLQPVFTTFIIFSLGGNISPIVLLAGSLVFFGIFLVSFPSSMYSKINNRGKQIQEQVKILFTKFKTYP